MDCLNDGHLEGRQKGPVHPFKKLKEWEKRKGLCGGLENWYLKPHHLFHQVDRGAWHLETEALDRFLHAVLWLSDCQRYRYSRGDQAMRGVRR